MREIRIIDTTLRDGPQCLWATRITTPMMLPIAQRLDSLGLESIDLAGAIQFDVCVRYLREDPWERVRLMRSKVVDTPLRALVRSKNLISFDLVPDDIIALWVDRLYHNGFRVIGAFDGLNDMDNVLFTVSRAKELGAQTFGALAFSESPVHTDDLYVQKAKLLVDSGVVDTVMLKDAGGLLTPDRIRTLVPALKGVLGDIPLEIHSHCLTGLAPLVYLEAARLGADQLHCSIWPLASGAAQPSSQQLMHNLPSVDCYAPLDADGIAEISDHFLRIAQAEGKPVGQPLDYDAFHFKHQVPGGMLSNLKFQLEQAGIPERFDEVLEECAVVREELGWPIMITPFAQLVGTQAVFNVVHGKRYHVVPDEVKKYALGHYGDLPAPVYPDVLDRIVARGSSRIPTKPPPLEPAVERLRTQYPGVSDEHRLLYFMFAGSQVDDMRAAGPMATQWRPPRHPVVELVDELANRPQVEYVKVSKGDLRFEARATTTPGEVADASS
ncbi:MAG: pyruvate carboxylase subunit B [Streptosporangiales bacterium]|nr:pyruvate carboxylase subunit B [Streptosporangiales bacterium]